MTRLHALAFACFGATCAQASPVTVSIHADDWTRIDVDIATDPAALAFDRVALGGRTFDRLRFDEALNLDDVGLPDLPTLYRLVAVDPALYYTVELTLDGGVVFPDVTLAPIQRDLPDRNVPVRFQINDELYRTDMEIGSETLLAMGQATLAGVPVLPLKITPLHYNPAQRRLTVWTKVHATIRGETKDGSPLAAHRAPHRLAAVTPFQRSQIGNLVENYDQLLAGVGAKSAARLLVLTTADLLPAAARIAVAAQRPGISADILTVTAGIAPADLKAQIAASYAQGDLDSVLLLGDEAHLPLYAWGNNTPGDSFYSFLDGDDYYADVGLGRLPAASLAEAELFAAKLEAYSAQKAAGSNKNVLLVAHSEEYPGKYTANQEEVRTAANPRRLAFTKQYAGAGADNPSALAAINAGPAIVAYRGHGSYTDWYSWASNSLSFGAAELHSLAPARDKLAVYLEIACENGGLQNDGRSFAEAALLTGSRAFPGTGAVAVLASTVDSFTTTNDVYNKRLFEYLGSESNLALGNINGLAANRLVRDNGGSVLPNIKMYVLFAHPLVAPPLE